MLAAIDSALSVPIASRPQSLPVWRALLFGDAEHKLLPHRAGGHRRAGSTRPAASVSVALEGMGQAEPVGGQEASGRLLRRAMQWSVPAVAATGLMVVVTWVDTGVLRTAETAEPSAAVAEESVPVPPLGEGEFADVLQSGGVGPTMILVPEGSMEVPCWPPGCTALEDRPTEEIVFERPYGLSKYEITEAEFARFVAETGYGAAPALQGDGRLPVVNVSWQDAVRTRNGCRSRRAASTGCPAKWNGSMRRGPARGRLRGSSAAYRDRIVGAGRRWLARCLRMHGVSRHA